MLLVHGSRFEQLNGVSAVTSGYAGGDPRGAHYEMVSAGKSDHAESIEITFDPARISFGKLLMVFFAVAHDPTQLNRQGRTMGGNTGRPYFTAARNRSVSPKRISSNLTRRRLFQNRSSRR